MSLILKSNIFHSQLLGVGAIEQETVWHRNSIKLNIFSLYVFIWLK